MSIRSITATFDCDACGIVFKVDVPPAKTAWIERQDMMSIAEDCISDGQCSRQADLHLCGNCTRIADSIGPEDHVPTRQEILEAVGAL